MDYLQDISSSLDGVGFGGFGSSRKQALTNAFSLFGMSESDVIKSLATSGSVGANGSALIAESLDPMVKIITQNPKNFARILARMHTYKANAISEQFNRVTRLGLSDGGGWRAEGLLGIQDSPNYVRDQRMVRFLGYTGAVTTTLKRAAESKYGDIKKLQVSLLLQKMLLDLENNLLWGNTTLNPYAFQGLVQQAATDSYLVTNKVVTGLAGSRETYVSGGTLTAQDIRAAARKAVRAGGVPTALHCSLRDLEALGAAEDGNIRYLVKDVDSRIAKGMRIAKIVTDVNDLGIEVIWNAFLTGERGKQILTPKDPSGTEFHADVPAQLASGSFSGAAAAGGKIPVDTYYYGIAPVGDAGEGRIRLLSTGYTTDNTNGTIDLTITLPPDKSKIRSWRIYRSTDNGTDYARMVFWKEVAIDTSAATQVISDDGSLLPGSRRALLVNEEMLALGFLLPPEYMELPRIDHTDRFSIDAEAVVQNYAPEHGHHFYNIGGSAVTPAVID